MCRQILVTLSAARAHSELSRQSAAADLSSLPQCLSGHISRFRCTAEFPNSFTLSLLYSIAACNTGVVFDEHRIKLPAQIKSISGLALSLTRKQATLITRLQQRRSSARIDRHGPFAPPRLPSSMWGIVDSDMLLSAIFFNYNDMSGFHGGLKNFEE